LGKDNRSLFGSMEKLRISVCTVVLNEEKTIEKLLESLIFQTLKPWEVIIVDGGSTDKTVDIIKKIQEKHPFIKLYVKKSNIPEARNFAIKKAKTGLIAFIDAGCFAKKDWLEKLVKILKEKDSDIASSLYEMRGKTYLQKAFSLFVGVSKEYFKKNDFIPSTRSVLLKKKVWEKLGGFNQNLSAGEDHEFFLKAKSMGFRFANLSNAKVVWFDFETLGVFDMARKFFNYAEGDAQNFVFWSSKGFFTHNLKILSVFLRYFLFLCLFLIDKAIFVVIFCLYLAFSFFKFRKSQVSFKTRAYLPVVQIMADFSAMAGFLRGLFKKWT